MTQNGIFTSIYLQKTLINGVDVALEMHADIFNSRNAFINAAIARELRRLKILPQEENQTCRTS